MSFKRIIFVILVAIFMMLPKITSKLSTQVSQPTPHKFQEKTNIDSGKNDQFVEVNHVTSKTYTIFTLNNLRSTYDFNLQDSAGEFCKIQKTQTAVEYGQKAYLNIEHNNYKHQNGQVKGQSIADISEAEYIYVLYIQQSNQLLALLSNRTLIFYQINANSSIDHGPIKINRSFSYQLEQIVTCMWDCQLFYLLSLDQQRNQVFFRYFILDTGKLRQIKFNQVTKQLKIESQKQWSGANNSPIIKIIKNPIKSQLFIAFKNKIIRNSLFQQKLLYSLQNTESEVIDFALQGDYLIILDRFAGIVYYNIPNMVYQNFQTPFMYAAQKVYVRKNIILIMLQIHKRNFMAQIFTKYHEQNSVQTRIEITLNKYYRLSNRVKDISMHQNYGITISPNTLLFFEHSINRKSKLFQPATQKLHVMHRQYIVQLIPIKRNGYLSFLLVEYNQINFVSISSLYTFKAICVFLKQGIYKLNMTVTGTCSNEPNYTTNQMTNYTNMNDYCVANHLYHFNIRNLGKQTATINQRNHIFVFIGICSLVFILVLALVCWKARINKIRQIVEKTKQKRRQSQERASDINLKPIPVILNISEE